ncbi:MAG: phage tail family protein [Lachnospiraceae bacterium]|nr:phage tail family protein [Lachnospiraceae bacterium]
MYQIWFGGRSSREYNILGTRPDMPCGGYVYDTKQIPGRDGSLLIRRNNLQDMEIPVDFVFLCRPEKWQKRFREAKGWLLSGETELIFEDDPEMYYKVKKVSVGEVKRHAKRAGTFTASFLVEGAQYYIIGKKKVSYDKIPYNPGIESHPVFNIEGEGLCTITVNGKSVTVNVGQNAKLDTHRMLCYRADGTVNNTIMHGYYEDLYLKPGKNEVTVSEGFSVMVAPNWRC